MKLTKQKCNILSVILCICLVFSATPTVSFAADSNMVDVSSSDMSIQEVSSGDIHTSDVSSSDMLFSDVSSSDITEDDGCMRDVSISDVVTVSEVSGNDVSMGDNIACISTADCTGTYANGFCSVCGGYQPAVETTDKYDFNGDEVTDIVYEISNAGQLYWFAALVNGAFAGTARNNSANAILTEDIVVNSDVLTTDASGNDILNETGTESFRAWTPIGSMSYANRIYKGIFDGDNHTISGLYGASSNGKVANGLFGYVAEQGRVQKVSVSDSYFSGMFHAAGIVGLNYGNVDNCTNAALIVTEYSRSGGVVGLNEGGCITNCTNNGTVFGGDYSSENGGVVGRNNGGTVDNCTNSGTLRFTYRNSGGVVGFNVGGIVSNCTNSGTVGGKIAMGGIVGYNSGGAVNKCCNSGVVTGHRGVDTYEEGGCIGGIVGYSFGGAVSNSFNTGTVSGYIKIGGVEGHNDGSLYNCFNNGNVSGSYQVGSIVGEITKSSNIMNCFYLPGTAVDESNVAQCGIGASESGSFTSDVEEKTTGKTAEEFASGEVTYLFHANQRMWDENGNAVSVWGQALGTDAYPVLGGDKVYRLKGQDYGTYNYSNTMGTDENCAHDYSFGWNDTEHWEECSCGMKKSVIAHSYERGFCECGAYQPAVDSNDDGIYEISNAGQLYWLAEYINRGNESVDVVLTQDIVVNSNVLTVDVSGNSVLNEAEAGEFITWTPIGSIVAYGYNGVFDGAGHSISGLYTNTGNNIGLFGCVGDEGTVKNVSIVGSYISGNSSVGAVAGWNDGIIDNCSNSGIVTGSGQIGGLVGHDDGGSVINCSNSSKITGANMVGGIVGYGDETGIQNCSNSGEVSIKYNGGGIAGSIYGQIENCYNIGTVNGQDVGGIVGEIQCYDESLGAIINCYNKGLVSGYHSENTSVGDAAGIAFSCWVDMFNCYNEGVVEGKAASGLTYYTEYLILNCYNKGTINGEDYAAGLVYDSYGSVRNSFNVGTLTGETFAPIVVESNASRRNCYYLAEDVSGNETKTAEQFASGEVTYLLSQSVSGGDTWYQNIDNGEEKDAHPVLDNTHGTVYAVEGGYSNTEDGSTDNPDNPDNPPADEKHVIDISSGDCIECEKKFFSGGAIINLSNVGEGGFVYDGTAKTPEIIVTLGNNTLVKDTDYTVAYENNINAGTATVIVSGKGDYAGEKKYNFTIAKAQLEAQADKVTEVAYDAEKVYIKEAVGLMPADAGEVWTTSEPVIINSVGDLKVNPWGVDDNGMIDAVLSGGTEGDSITFTIVFVSTNYENVTVKVIVNLVNNPKEAVTYNVVFDMQGHGIALEDLLVNAGAMLEEPETPVEEGYIFRGWYKDAVCTKVWDFATDSVQENITLYACWTEDIAEVNFNVQEIADQYYTGSALKPAVKVYDAKTGALLKSGKNYTIKYYNNTKVNASDAIGGIGYKGNSTVSNDKMDKVITESSFSFDLPYVTITGKGNYGGILYVNFNILPTSISDEEGNLANGFTSKYTDQLTASTKSTMKPFTSLKYKKSMKAGTDYTVELEALKAFDNTGAVLTEGVAVNGGTAAIPTIPKGYTGTFQLKINGIGNYAGEITKTIYVQDKSVMLKNAVITLGANLKKQSFNDGKEITLTPAVVVKEGKKNVYYAVENGVVTDTVLNATDVFTVKAGSIYLVCGKDYTVSYTNNKAVGTATMTITGMGDYVGSKSVTFKITGVALKAKSVAITGLNDKPYTGKAITQNDVQLAYKKPVSKGVTEDIPLIYGKDYTISYKNNIKAGTATMTFKMLPTSGYTGTFTQTFKIMAVNLNAGQIVLDVEGTEASGNIVANYTKAGAKPKVTITDNGKLLTEGKDYTVKYTNNTTVTTDKTTKKPMVTIIGKGNYTGTVTKTFTINPSDIKAAYEAGELTVTVAATAFNTKKADSYAYKPKVTVKAGNKTLKAGKDYTITGYGNNTQEAVAKYLDKLAKGESTEGLVPYVTIAAGTNGTYMGEALTVNLHVYRTKLSSGTLYVVVNKAVYTGNQSTPGVTVYYGSAAQIKATKNAVKNGMELEKAVDTNKLIKLTEGNDYTLSYGTNVTAGTNKGSVKISGIGLYGGSVTVKFTIEKMAIAN